ncbi:hypothetical protein Tco_1002307 [Tanacetum coccineum]|uniref:Uncharacterized protein n=1 Tax=Tanacetum coccineum TaxID=301880 RepID=A0ABQ5F701_9ASTR
MPLQGLGDESLDEEHQFKMDMEAMYEMEREQIANDEDDQFWEDCVREFDHVEEPNDDKGSRNPGFVCIAVDMSREI